MAITMVEVQKQLTAMEGRLTRMEKLFSKVSSKTGQVSAQIAKSRSPGPPKRRQRDKSEPRDRRQNPRKESQRRQDSNKGKRKSVSHSTSKKRIKTPLSKLPDDLLKPEEREKFKNDIKAIRDKNKVEKTKWDSLNPKQKAISKMSVKLQVDEIVAKRNWLIIERAEKGIKKGKDGDEVDEEF